MPPPGQPLRSSDADPLSAAGRCHLDPAGQTVQTRCLIGLELPGSRSMPRPALTALTAPGEYLLLLDVVTPERGSLVASGADPTLVRITVLPT